MITRATIEQKIDEYNYKVRIPIFDRGKDDSLATPTKDLSIAVASLPKGMYGSLQEGDVVFVGFENNQIESPVILGHLYREDLFKSEFSINTVNTLEAKAKVILPTSITIGNNISYKEIFCLDGITENIQSQLDTLKQTISEMSAKLQELQEEKNK